MVLHKHLPAFFRAVPILLLASVASAQPEGEFPPGFFDEVIEKNPITLSPDSPRSSLRQKLGSSVCPCSPSARGHPSLKLPKVQRFIALVREFYSLSRTNLRVPVVRIKLEKISGELQDEFGWEGYVNMEAALRARHPKLQLYCMYDIKSGRNLVPKGPNELASTKSCDQSPNLAARPNKLRTFIASPGPSPAPSGSPVSSLVGEGTSPTESPGVSPVQETPVPVDTSTVTRTPTPTETPSPSVSQSLSPSSSLSPSAPRNINEGCVAIEHLAGHAVQHRAHLRRAVLCSRGFCATPNHAIIVDGVWTSMKRLCAAGWSCAEDVRLVNNLKIAKVTRLPFNSRIVITPYDIRFPIVFSWIAQIAEDVVEVLLFALVIAICISCTLFAHGRMHVEEPISTSNKPSMTRTSQRAALGAAPYCRPNARPMLAQNIGAALNVVHC